MFISLKIQPKKNKQILQVNNQLLKAKIQKTQPVKIELIQVEARREGGVEIQNCKS
jgi:peroxiredoxin family protein